MASPDEFDDTATKSFLEHLQDLRKTIVWCAISLGVGMCVAIPLAPYILDLLSSPLQKAGKDPDTFLKVFQVAGGLAITLKVVFWAGLLVATPGIVMAIADFVFPGLTAKEKRIVRRSGVIAGFLFAAGVSMGYFVTLPVALGVMLKINAWIGVESEFVELVDYVGFVLKLLIAFGLAFELPVVVLALGYMGIISSKQLREKRPVVIVSLLVLAMLLTPPDPMTQLLMAVPMTILYEICIWLVRAKELKDRLWESGGEGEDEASDDDE
jgi:sec-independent protein translocase protein TatC